jgi:hypothetical protein
LVNKLTNIPLIDYNLSALTRQCVQGRRFGTLKELRENVVAWARSCNKNQKGVQWQFSIENERAKLNALYPSFYIKKSRNLSVLC